MMVTRKDNKDVTRYDLSQGKIFVKDTFIMPISILYSLIMYSIITKNKFYI